MAHLFIANLTKQHHTFAYRPPEPDGKTESRELRFEQIGVGQQVRLGEDMNPEQIDAIIEQHAVYGLKDAKEIDRSREFVGLCYSIDKPVKLDAVVERIEKNAEVLDKKAQDRMEDLAGAVATGLESTGAPLTHTEVEVVEQTKGGATPSVNTGVEISSGGKPRHNSKPGPKAKASGQQ